MSSRHACAIIALLVGALGAAETKPAPAPAAEATPAPKAKAGATANVDAIPEEEKWIFEPPIGRREDIFIDIEARLTLENQQKQGPRETAPPPRMAPDQDNQLEAAIAWAGSQAERIEALILSRRWDEAIQESDNGVRTLEKVSVSVAGESEQKETLRKRARELIEIFKGHRQAAEEAKLYEEAQAKFDALGLKVEGILWAPEGSLAIITGEPRALKINEPVKDCMVLNIDTNRVDFLFHYKRRRFEFQRYVGETPETAARSAARPAAGAKRPR